MRMFIQANDFVVWKVILDGPHVPTKEVNEKKVNKSMKEWDANDYKRYKSMLRL